METQKQHVQVPTMELGDDDKLKHIDPFVYASIKRYMNNETKTAFPSTTTLVQKTGLTLKTLKKSIDRLEEAGYITVKREFGKVNQYIFNEYKKFECFSYDFLDNKELSNKAKALLVAAQRYIIPEGEHTGIIRYDSKTLSELMNMSQSTLYRTEQELKSKGILSLVPTNQKELMKVDNQFIINTGFNKCERVYNFESMLNLIGLKFKMQDERLDEHDSKLEKLSLENQELKRQVEELSRVVQKLDRQTIIL